MGNTQSVGVQFCSNKQLYTYSDARVTLKEQLNMAPRVGYEKKIQKVQKVQKKRQAFQRQQVRQQQAQDMPEKLQELQVEVVQPLQAVKKPTFNVYVSCIKDELLNAREEQPPKLEVDNSLLEMEAAMEETMQTFEGLFGNVIVHKNGLVLYTDINGEKYCEDFEAEGLKKTFPMGISYGELSKSIWFKDITQRDECFDAMTYEKPTVDIPAPPSYDEVTANPMKYRLPKEHKKTYKLRGFTTSGKDLHLEMEDEPEDDNIKVFDGLKGRNVIVHADNIVLYTDINGEKYCVEYDPNEIKKCFPCGITWGGLPKSIWFNDGVERDLCFELMKWNKEESEKMEETTKKEVFQGLYGNVSILPDSQIEYTSLTGAKITTYFEPDEIAEVFPLGISYGRLPKTVWFTDPSMRTKCLETMRSM